MKSRHTPDRKNWSMTAGLFLGIMIFGVVMAAGAVLTTSLLMGEKIAVDSGKYILNAVLLLAAFLGSLAAAKKIGEKRLLVCGIVAAAILFVIIGANFLFYDGEFYGLWLALLMVLSGCALASVISAQEKRKNLRHRKSRSR